MGPAASLYIRTGVEQRFSVSAGVGPNESGPVKLLLTASTASRVRPLCPGKLLPALGETPCALP
jgi:hypothetical protein